MLQAIGVGQFDNHFVFRQAEADDAVLIYREDAVLVTGRDGGLRLPRFRELPEAFRGLYLRYAFSIDGDRYFFGDVFDEGPVSALPEDLIFVASREYRNMEPQETAFACCVGESLHRWHYNNQHCGRCGAFTEDSMTEQAIYCPICDLTVYPKICPAVIVAVCDGDRLLLTKYRGRAFKRYALVAGFNEIGESIEETVHREVLEETGLRVKNLRFYKSQPWVVTDSLLMGFFCELDGKDRITLEEEELSVAQWFRREEIPTDHSGISLTGEMIEVFRAEDDPYSR